MKIPGKKREMVGDFGIMDFEDRYRQKVKIAIKAKGNFCFIHKVHFQ